MAVTKVKAVGSHACRITRQSLADAARFWSYDFLLDEHGQFKERFNRSFAPDLVFVELHIEGEFRRFEEIEIYGQVPYLPIVLDASGTTLLCKLAGLPAERDRQLNTWSERRLCFFLHRIYFSTSKRRPLPALRVGEGTIELAARTVLPERLRPFQHYVPVD